MSTRTVEQRAYDHLYDPVWTTPATGVYRTSEAPVSQSNAIEIVSGTSRHKYFRQPIVPNLHAVAPSVLLAATSLGNDPLVASVRPTSPLTKSVLVQTKYRESEAQTVPYTPAYLIPNEDKEPEVLMLSQLPAQQCHPVGLRTVTMIELAREKRNLEAALPPITDEASLNFRKKLMEEQELREFELRSNEFDIQREKRIASLRVAIDARDSANEFLAEQRVEALRQRLLEDRDKSLSSIQQKRIKVLRKLTKSRGGLNLPGGFQSRKTRDIIGEYADFSSTVYAPIRREGQADLDKGGNKYDVLALTAPLTSLDSLAVMESTIPSKMLRTVVVRPGNDAASKSSKKSVGNNAAERKNLAVTADLALMEQVIKSGGLNKSNNNKEDEEANAKTGGIVPSWKKGQQTNKRLERPATPRVEALDADSDAQNVALLLLQRLLRGRAVQNTMFEGKERRKELIAEVREADKAGAYNADVIEASDQKPTSSERKAKVHNSAIDTVAGETTSALLDFLAKDLVRKEEKERLEAIANKADAERRRREVTEGGRRQEEEIAREREDEGYRQIMRVHHATATTYVSTVMDEAIEKIISDLVNKMAQGNSELMGEVGAAGVEGAKDIAASLLESSAKQIGGEKGEVVEGERFVDAAHDTVGGVMADITLRSTL